MDSPSQLALPLHALRSDQPHRYNSCSLQIAPKRVTTHADIAHQRRRHLCTGLRALRTELRKLGDVVVVAPATEQSAAGHSVTLLTPLLVNEVFEDDAKTFIGWRWKAARRTA